MTPTRWAAVGIAAYLLWEAMHASAVIPTIPSRRVRALGYLLSYVLIAIGVFIIIFLGGR